MSTTNATGNGTSDTPEKENATPKSGTRSASRSKRSSSGGLVKAKANDAAVIMLEDHTRVVETDSLPNHRPITISDFEVVGSLDAAGVRPIMANTFEIANIDTLPGHRPIAVSTLHIADLHFLPGNRPIAPNDVVDPPATILMGYLD